MYSSLFFFLYAFDSCFFLYKIGRLILSNATKFVCLFPRARYPPPLLSEALSEMSVGSFLAHTSTFMAMSSHLSLTRCLLNLSFLFNNLYSITDTHHRSLHALNRTAITDDLKKNMIKLQVSQFLGCYFLTLRSFQNCPMLNVTLSEEFRLCSLCGCSLFQTRMKKFPAH